MLWANPSPFPTKNSAARSGLRTSRAIGSHLPCVPCMFFPISSRHCECSFERRGRGWRGSWEWFKWCDDMWKEITPSTSRKGQLEAIAAMEGKLRRNGPRKDDTAQFVGVLSDRTSEQRGSSQTAVDLAAPRHFSYWVHSTVAL